jgi:ribosome-associated protein
MKEFKLSGEFIPLCDLLKVTDLCETGGMAKHVIAEGQVLVDGIVETRKRCKIRKDQTVEFKGQKLKIVSSF